MPIVECTCTRARHHHGHPRMHDADGCTCTPCMRAYRLIGHQAHQGLRRTMDAEPIRQHIRDLRAAGMTLATIGERAGVTSRTIIAIDNEHQQAVQRTTGAAILNVHPDPEPWAMVDATGTRRRLQALALRGWTTNQIAERIGISKSAVSQLQHDRATTRQWVATKVRAGIGDMWITSPPTTTPSTSRVAKYTANRAHRNGWQPLAAWDDIDDPDCQPEGAGEAVHSPALDEARWRIDLGESVATIARDLGVGADYLQRQLEQEAA